MAAFESTRAHWESVYAARAPTEVSWYEARPARSFDLIRASGIGPAQAIIDVGAGASLLVDELLAAGYRDITLLDVSGAALRGVRERLGERAPGVAFIDADVRRFAPTRRYALWHDRAVFHFLTDPQDRALYVGTLRGSLDPGGQVIIATFGPEGPERCSGLAVQRYDAVTLTRELGKDFRVIDSSILVHRTPQGVGQQFLYCRFERVAA